MRNVFSFDEMSRCLRPRPHTPSLFGIHPCRAEEPSRLLECVFINDGAVPIKTSGDMRDAQPGPGRGAPQGADLGLLTHARAHVRILYANRKLAS